MFVADTGAEGWRVEWGAREGSPGSWCAALGLGAVSLALGNHSMFLELGP